MTLIIYLEDGHKIKIKGKNFSDFNKARNRNDMSLEMRIGNVRWFGKLIAVEELKP